MSGTIESMPVPRGIGHLGGGGALLIASTQGDAVPAWLWTVVAAVTAISVLITLSRLVPRFW